MPEFLKQTSKRIVLPVAVLLLFMIGLGLLITKQLNDVWPFTVEDGINREFAGDRTGPLNAISEIFSLLGSTPVIIGFTAIAAAVLRIKRGRWREPLFLCAAVCAQAIVFFFTTLVIDRQRPKVAHLDSSPPTSSFPSGHTSAAVALYCGLAVVFFVLAQHTWAKWLAVAFVLIPIGVAVARLYRGMHHPTDVTSSFLNGIACLIIMARSILNRAVAWTVPHLRSKPGSGTKRLRTAA